MKNIEDIILNVLTNTAAEEEVESLNEWIQSSPENDQIYREILNYWYSHPQTTSNEEISRIWHSFSQKHIAQNEPAISLEVGSETPNIHKFPVFMRMAAAILVLFLAGGGIWIASTWNSTETTEYLADNERYNPPGQRSMIDLPDGSRVWLNADSKISFPAQFSNDSRRIILEGEAFFEVEKDPSRPFIVFSGNVNTTALGTSFNVKAFPEEHTIDVALVTGKVGVEVTGNKINQDSAVILLPGENLQYDKEDITLSKTVKNTDKAYSWKNGVLQFDGENVKEVAKTLGRWYGVEFSLQQEGNLKTLLRHRLNANEKSLEEALEDISRVADYRFEIKQNVIEIYPK